MTSADSSWLSLCNWLYDLAVILVILGVGLELPEVVTRWSKHFFSKRKKNLAIEPWHEPPRDSNDSSWGHVMEGIGWFVLLIGLGLEQWAHGQITNIKDRQISTLTTNLDSTTRELLQLETPRMFMLSKQLEAAGRLKRFAGTKAVINWSPEDECSRVAQEIHLTLITAKWDASLTTDRIETWSPDSGVIILTHDEDKQCGEAGRSLIRELASTEIFGIWRPIPSVLGMATNVVLIRVGRKPSSTEAKDLELRNSLSDPDITDEQRNKLRKELEDLHQLPKGKTNRSGGGAVYIPVPPNKYQQTEPAK